MAGEVTGRLVPIRDYLAGRFRASRMAVAVESGQLTSINFGTAYKIGYQLFQIIAGLAMNWKGFLLRRPGFFIFFLL